MPPPPSPSITHPSSAAKYSCSLFDLETASTLNPIPKQGLAVGKGKTFKELAACRVLDKDLPVLHFTVEQPVQVPETAAAEVAERDLALKAGYPPPPPPCPGGFLDSGISHPGNWPNTCCGFCLGEVYFKKKNPHVFEGTCRRPIIACALDLCEQLSTQAEQEK